MLPLGVQCLGLGHVTARGQGGGQRDFPDARHFAHLEVPSPSALGGDQVLSVLRCIFEVLLWGDPGPRGGRGGLLPMKPPAFLSVPRCWLLFWSLALPLVQLCLCVSLFLCLLLGPDPLSPSFSRLF